ncbi:phytoene desaturase [Paenibacillus sambharensis]|uniref:Phytoene desaturase n=1 Tax=Paenibacillus sambharensis TaxID=1803190 RepID=A0A2W1LGD8_9BACL|nr:phytoene desaturase family protein [Paenibacillus sambharensis]PZD94075.1 phytoene desaturase [Paenibacillus sambharensis]
MNTTGTVVVIGAGPGGLAAAMLLASQGYRVKVMEKQAYVGGRTSAVKLGDYRFDRGPTFLMMPGLLEDMFHSVGRSLHDYVQLKEIDPLYRLQFGSIRFEATRDRKRMLAEIERCFPGESAGYERFMEEEGKKFKRVMPLLQRPFQRVADYVKPDVLRALPRLNLRDTVYGRLSRYFQDERLRYAFAFQAKYLGMSPWECPGTFTILSYIEHAFGLWHPIGGVNRICGAMADVTCELGGTIHLNSGVKQVLTSGGRAAGVLLESGERVDADHVVINADFGTAVTQLFEPGQLRKYNTDKINSLKLSCSAYMLYLGVNRRIDLPHHTVMFADDYPRNVRELMGGSLSGDASIYVHNPSAIDPTMAPEGKSALYVLMPAPNLKGATDWSDERVKAEVKAYVLDRLEREPELAGLRSDIEEEAVITPLDWEQSIHVYQGAAFNIAHSVDQMMMLRPHNRFQDARNCWLVGGGTHPGSGLPTILESARISAGLIMKSDGKAAPFHQKSQGIVQPGTIRPMMKGRGSV